MSWSSGRALQPTVRLRRQMLRPRKDPPPTVVIWRYPMLYQLAWLTRVEKWRPQCLQDQVGDRVGVRDQRQVARLDFDRLRAHPLGHETLQVGIDRPVLGGHGIEGWLGAPGGIRRLFCRQRFLEGLLNRVEDARLFRRQVAREVAEECLLVKSAPMVVENNPAEAGASGSSRQRGIVLAGIGCPCGDVDEGGDLRRPPPPPTRSFWGRKEWPTSTVGGGGAAPSPPRGLGRLLQRRQYRILHAGAADAFRLEPGDDLRPAGARRRTVRALKTTFLFRRCLGASDAMEQGEGVLTAVAPINVRRFMTVLDLALAIWRCSQQASQRLYR